VEQTKANGMGTFYWMGLSDGENRSVPVFNQTDLKDAIIKGYYGDDGYTGISENIAGKDEKSAAAMYDISGRKICGRPSRGIYISNKRKYYQR
jgi:hypothetical protein